MMTFRSKRKSSGDLYISDPIDTDRDGTSLTLIDIMSDDDDIVDMLELKNKSEQLYKFIGQVLTPREREIVCLRYGLSNALPLTQREVAKKLKISRSYVSRLEKKALEKLKDEFEKKEK